LDENDRTSVRKPAWSKRDILPPLPISRETGQKRVIGLRDVRIVELYPLAQAPKTYDRVAEGKARFRAVLAMESLIRSVRASLGRLTGYPHITL